MNKLSIDRQAQIIKVLCEGNSIRSAARITDSSINTVVKLLKEVGGVCLEHQDKVFHNLSCKRIECDEIWSFCYAKDKNVPKDKQGQFGYGDVWTFIAIDADTKLIPSWYVGLRNNECAYEFISDLASRLANRVQLTTDGHKIYLNAIEDVFHANIDYAILVKLYGNPDQGHDTKYSPAQCISAEAKQINGSPDLSKASTSYIERQNLSMRMGMRRFTRLTNGFSKKIENQVYATALYFMYYNFVRPHKTLAYPYPRTPAMASGISDHIWATEEIVNLLYHV